jgi:ATP-dependent RNA helicase DDX51/DBP6
MVVTSTSLKPLVLFHLVQEHQIRNALVFTKSTESTIRLLHLFKFFFQMASGSMEVDEDRAAATVRAEAFSSDLAPTQRTAVLERFKRQEVDVFVTY